MIVCTGLADTVGFRRDMRSIPSGPAFTTQLEYRIRKGVNLPPIAANGLSAKDP
jgi:hypothetical protein